MREIRSSPTSIDVWKPARAKTNSRVIATCTRSFGRGGPGSFAYWPLGRCKIPAQFVCGPTRPISGRVALNPPAVAERPDVDDVEPESVDQLRDDALGV